MKTTTFFKSETAQQEIFALYDAKLAELGIEYQSRMIETSFGETHVLITGNPENPPMLLVHGSNGCAPIALESYPRLAEQYQVFAVDVLAQPNKSAANRLSMKNLDYGKWMHELIGKLNLANVTMAGFSLGGLVILKTLLHSGNNIEEVFLAAPAHIVNGNPLKALLNVFFPMRKYMKTRDQTQVEKFLHSLFSDRDEFAIQYLSKVFIDFEMDFTPVPTITKAEAQSITTPITLIAAEKDLLFPGKKMLKRAKKIFPTLKKEVLVPESKHVQGREDLTKIENLILHN